MRLLDELATEHELIDAVVGSLRTYVAARIAGTADASAASRFIRFLQLYAGHFHHAREEDTLFVALRERAELPEDGPLAVLRHDHRVTAALLERMAPLLEAGTLDPARCGELNTLALQYSRILWHHIDAENSVLFPESEARLRKQGVLELPSRAMTAEEAAAMADGRSLVVEFPPLFDRGIVRGDGCVCCPAMVDNCPGLERAWWSEAEWDELEDHLAEG
ncbi:MAG TPA: hemerythrin domain-containing protein [Vicinamibacterales bacterium]